jgi:DNA repair exonuclease SbcCD ATPase subunit
MAEQASCGGGLAEHSAVPAKIGEMLASLAENLELHVPAIDIADANGRSERDAYESLAAEYRAIASRLQSVAEQMAGYRDLPIASHHEAALTTPRVMSAFRRFLELQDEVVQLIQRTAERDRHILEAIESG